jgi:hypothetical protein
MGEGEPVRVMKTENMKDQEPYREVGSGYIIRKIGDDKWQGILIMELSRI